MHADASPANPAFLDGLRAAADRGAFIYGECGGFMALGHSPVDRQGRGHAMAGLLPVTTSFAEPHLHLGYRRMRLLTSSPLGQAGTTYRGHEFHYARLLDTGDAPPLFDVTDTHGQTLGPLGAQVGTAAGSFLHLIDRSTEPTDTIGRTGHLPVVE